MPIKRGSSTISKAAVAPPAAIEMVGTVVGRYKLLQQIGEGGMSLVYLAEQAEPVRRKVALKIVKPGPWMSPLRLPLNLVRIAPWLNLTHRDSRRYLIKW